MPLVFTETEARFEDVCTVEDALPLLEFLKNSDAPQVDLSACTYLRRCCNSFCPRGPELQHLPPIPALRAGWSRC